jgi:hypothetical protein
MEEKILASAFYPPLISAFDRPFKRMGTSIAGSSTLEACDPSLTTSIVSHKPPPSVQKGGFNFLDSSA